MCSICHGLWLRRYGEYGILLVSLSNSVLHKPTDLPKAIPHPWKQLIRKGKINLQADGFMILLHLQERAQKVAVEILMCVFMDCFKVSPSHRKTSIAPAVRWWVKHVYLQLLPPDYKHSSCPGKYADHVLIGGKAEFTGMWSMAMRMESVLSSMLWKQQEWYIYMQQRNICSQRCYHTVLAPLSALSCHCQMKTSWQRSAAGSFLEIFPFVNLNSKPHQWKQSR